jgi:hypothetical protein
MALLLVILIPLAALAIYAVVFDLRRRRRQGAPKSHDISSAARMRTRTPMPPAASAPPAAFLAGLAAGLAAGSASDDPHVSWTRAQLAFSA